MEKTITTVAFRVLKSNEFSNDAPPFLDQGSRDLQPSVLGWLVVKVVHRERGADQSTHFERFGYFFNKESAQETATALNASDAATTSLS